ncbi:hypothetical protein J6590_064715 [Homalodisca vitripennis]|nr:hypothetical protein J6590_064715 [Homalodisca vitripennis]
MNHSFLLNVTPTTHRPLALSLQVPYSVGLAPEFWRFPEVHPKQIGIQAEIEGALGGGRFR